MKDFEKATKEGLKFLDGIEKILRSTLLKLYVILNNELLSTDSTGNTELESTILSLEKFLVNSENNFYKVKKLLKPWKKYEWNKFG